MEESVQPFRHDEVDERLQQGWTMILTGRPGKRREVDDLADDYTTYEETSRWCEQLFGAIGGEWDAYGFWTFLFKNPKDALLFKLTWGMTS
jgi:hypothetical protein